MLKLNKIINLDEFFNENKPAQNSECFLPLFESKQIKIAAIASNSLVETGWMINQGIEFCLLYKGTALLSDKQGQLIHMKAGDILKIDAKAKHKIVSTSPEALWLAIYLN
ncbi:cupin domain-containing protein [Mycoplasmopsis columbinasalis]|uniref:Cupin n=1 Tax=Mycoplasmopsis columbinasalis TaxID=114880 RepID=A0A449BAY6_9BACT|nr:hypothetical protein [Mycoplasmopsis columbinasalis]VEU78353.1 Uncharacterised protein [Mycoplasmopsis columbinasalis]